LTPLPLLRLLQDGTVLIGQDVIDPPEGYVTPYSRRSEGNGTPAAIAVHPSDCFYSFKRLLGKS
jgi:hypothetical protein